MLDTKGRKISCDGLFNRFRLDQYNAYNDQKLSQANKWGLAENIIFLMQTSSLYQSSLTLPVFLETEYCRN
jgi:hypothetical protein